LRDALKKFRTHADAWEDVWKALKDGRVPADEDVRGPPFPDEVIEALNKEIEETRRRAGERRERVVHGCV
jgi:hypothetical protein